MILFIKIYDFLKWRNIYIMTFNVAHWDTWDDSFVLLIIIKKIIQHTNDKCHVFVD
jgi:hypothetical protein